MRLLLRPEARQDALDAYAWYEAQRSGLGDDFRDELDTTVARIQAQPSLYRVLWRDTRRARLRRFPYSVFYREFADAVIVVAIFHGRRDPKSSRRRR